MPKNYHERKNNCKKMFEILFKIYVIYLRFFLCF